MISPNTKQKEPAVKLKLIALIDYLSEGMQIKLLRYLEKKLNIKVGLDISAFGAFIETNVILPAGQKLSMSFSLPNHQKPFNFRGQIVWSGSQGIGVKFDYLSPHQEEILKTFSEQSEEIFEIIS